MSDMVSGDHLQRAGERVRELQEKAADADAEVTRIIMDCPDCAALTARAEAAEKWIAYTDKQSRRAFIRSERHVRERSGYTRALAGLVIRAEAAEAELAEAERILLAISRYSQRKGLGIVWLQRAVGMTLPQAQALVARALKEVPVMSYPRLNSDCLEMLRYLNGRGGGDVAESTLGSRQGLRRVRSTIAFLREWKLVDVYVVEYPPHQWRVAITIAGQRALTEVYHGE